MIKSRLDAVGLLGSSKQNGDQVYKDKPKIEPYYINQICDWFKRQTGVDCYVSL